MVAEGVKTTRSRASSPASQGRRPAARVHPRRLTRAVRGESIPELWRLAPRHERDWDYAPYDRRPPSGGLAGAARLRVLRFLATAGRYARSGGLCHRPPGAHPERPSAPSPPATRWRAGLGALGCRSTRDATLDELAPSTLLLPRELDGWCGQGGWSTPTPTIARSGATLIAAAPRSTSRRAARRSRPPRDPIVRPPVHAEPDRGWAFLFNNVSGAAAAARRRGVARVAIVDWYVHHGTAPMRSSARSESVSPRSPVPFTRHRCPRRSEAEAGSPRATSACPPVGRLRVAGRLRRRYLRRRIASAPTCPPVRPASSLPRRPLAGMDSASAATAA